MQTVVHSTPIWLPPTQNWIYSQVSQLQLLGVNTHVACERVENLDQFPVRNLHQLNKEPLLRQLWQKALRKFRIQSHLNYLVAVGERTEANIIHSHFGHVGWQNLGAVRKLGVRHAVTFYGWDVNKLPTQQPIWKDRYHQLFEEADLFFCEGSYMAQSLVKLGCPPQKVKVQHLGVDVENLIFQPRTWDGNGPLRVLIAASFREKKGIPNAIDALQIIAREVPLRLTIIGDAGGGQESQQEKVRIHEALERSDLKEHTRFLGYQTHQAMLQEAYDHHLFLQPSIIATDGDTEGGAPVAIIEMLATGMPVVASTHCDIPEVVGPAFSHLLAPEGDVEKLAECIQFLLDNPDSWPSLLQEGRNHIASEYHQLRQAKHLSDHYLSIL